MREKYESEVLDTNEHEHVAASDKSCFLYDIHNKIKLSEIVFKTENFYVMINEHRAALKGKPLCLIFPKEHLLTIDDFDEKVSADFMDAIIKTSTLLNKAYGTGGSRIWIKSGKASWSLPHLHGHIMPVGGFWDYPMLIFTLICHVLQDTFFGTIFSKRRGMSPARIKKMADALRQQIYF